MEYIYAALLLHKLGKNVDEDSLKKVVTATGAEFDDTKAKSLIASLQGVDIDKELQSASLAAATPAAVQEKKEEKKEEKASEAAEGLSALFG
ncbi:MAG TPA: 50S ribosomal protein L12 [Candidatus Nanoarchaeia archaeon]|nr:50S ribosomal protein L12 [Candidatus Nanoarchaeia archaeon]